MNTTATDELPAPVTGVLTGSVTAARARYDAVRSQMDFEWTQQGKPYKTSVPVGELHPSLNALVNRCVQTPRYGGRGAWTTLTETECTSWAAR